MAQEILITDIVDLNGNIKDINTLISNIERIETAIQQVNKNPINLGNVNGYKELKQAIDQLTQSTNQLTAALQTVTKVNTGSFKEQAAGVRQATQSTKENTQSVGDNITAYDKLKKETKEAEVNAKNLAAQFGAQSKQALEAAAAYDVLRTKLDLVNSVTKNTNAKPFDANSVPFTSNTTAVNDEQAKAVAATGEAVNELEKSEAKATNTALAFGNAQLEATASVGDQAKVIPEIVGELDEYTGSISQNIQAQLENSKALSVNRAAQAELMTIYKANGALTSEQTTRLTTLKTEELGLVDANRNLTTTIRNQVKEFNSAGGSIDNLRAKVNLLQRQYEGLSAAEKRSQFGVNLKAQIDQLEPSLKSSEGEIGKFQRNVGNYAGSVVGAFKGAFSYLRQLAYILPGIGIAGIINVATDAIVSLTESILESGSAEEIANGETKKMIELQKELNDAVSSTTEAFVSYETTVAKSNSGVLDKLKGELAVLEASGVNAERTFALKKRIADLEQQGAASEQDINTRLATKERGEVIASLKTEIDLLEKRNVGFNKSNANTKRIEELKTELQSLDVLVTKDNAVGLSREYHRQNILKLDNQIIDANNKLGKLVSTDAASKDIERQKSYIQTLQQRKQIESQIFGELTSSQQKYVQSVTGQDELETQIAKFNADERRKYELESQKLLVEEKQALTHSILSDTRSSLQEQLDAIKTLSAEQEKLIEQEKKNVINNPGSSSVDRVLAEKRASEQLYALTVQTEDQKFQVKEKWRLRDLEAEKQAYTQKKQLEIGLLDELSASTEFNVNDRIKFVQAAFEAQKSVIDKEHDALVSSKEFTELTANEKLQIQSDYDNKLIELGRKTNQKITDVIRNSIQDQQRLREEDIADIDRLYKSLELNNTDQYTSDVIALNESLKGKLVSYESYLKERKSLDNKYKQATLENSIKDIEVKLQTAPFTGVEAQLQSAESNLNAFKSKLTQAKDNDEKESINRSISLAHLDVDQAKKNLDTKKDLEKQLDEYKKELSDSSNQYDLEKQKEKYAKIGEFLQNVSELANEMGNLGAAIIQKRINLIEEEQNALSDRYAKEQDLIKQSYTNQVIQQQKLAEAQARYNSQKAQLDARDRQEKIKQAKFEKDAAIANIILNTAAAVVKALPNIPLSIAAGVIGAAQLAVAIATPLPKFYKGKNVTATDNYEGYAWVDDGGKPEAIIRESGEVEIGGNSPRVTYLKSKDIVLPDAKMLAMNATYTAMKQPVFVHTTSNGLSDEKYMAGVKRIERAVKGVKLNVYNQNPIDLWMNGRIDTNSLFK